MVLLGGRRVFVCVCVCSLPPASPPPVRTNIADTEYLNPYSWVYDESIGVRVRLWLLASFVVSIGGIAAAIWVMSAEFVKPGSENPNQWTGIAMTLQTALIFFSSLLMLACKSFKNQYDQL